MDKLCRDRLDNGNTLEPDKGKIVYKLLLKDKQIKTILTVSSGNEDNLNIAKAQLHAVSDYLDTEKLRENIARKYCESQNIVYDTCYGCAVSNNFAQVIIQLIKEGL